MLKSFAETTKNLGEKISKNYEIFEKLRFSGWENFKLVASERRVSNIVPEMALFPKI